MNKKMFIIVCMVLPFIVGLFAGHILAYIIFHLSEKEITNENIIEDIYTLANNEIYKCNGTLCKKFNYSFDENVSSIYDYGGICYMVVPRYSDNPIEDGYWNCNM